MDVKKCTRDEARKLAASIRSSGWPAAKAVQLVLSVPNDKAERFELATAWVVRCTDEPTYVREDGYVR